YSNFSLLGILFTIVFIFAFIGTAQAYGPDIGQNQQPTVAIPTVTGTAIGPYIIVVSDPDEQINVRSGPGTDYPKIGVLLNRQQAPALGRLPGGTWVMVAYVGTEGGIGWVYAPLTQVYGDLPIVEAPPTPTPRVTPTIDPTLASQFVVNMPATRMPTFTPPPQLVIPTFPVENISTGTAGLPMGFVISGLAVLGFFGLILSLLRRR
ncbi:SH3 domain-containing protein, partial [Chloroflexota bacterium]